MMFTLLYAYATLMQWWRLISLKSKLKNTLNSQNALLVCSGSSIRDSRKNRSLENLLFRYPNRIGCTIVPKLKLNLTQWIAFPRNLRYFPIYLEDSRPKLKDNECVFVLIQTVLDSYTKHQSDLINVEDYGELLGWRTADTFEVVLKTDIDYLTKLILRFSTSEVDINHELQLIKIETVDVEGSATLIKYDKKYLKEQSLRYSYAPVHWTKFAAELKDLYAKIRDVTNPKIKIVNGSPKCSEAEAHENTKKTSKKYSDDYKNTLDVSLGAGDHRRHKHSTGDHHNKPQNKFEKKNKESLASTAKSSKLNKAHKKTADEKTEVGSKAKTPEADRAEPNAVSKSKTYETNKTKTEETENPTVENKIKHPTMVRQEATVVESTSKVPESEGTANADVAKPKTPKNKPESSPNKHKKDHRDPSRKHSSKNKEQAKESPKENGVQMKPTIAKPEEVEKVEAQQCVSSSGASVKPPNVLVYADSVVTKDNVKRVVYSILNKEKYTIYDLPLASSKQAAWNASTVLVVVCGNVHPDLTSQLIQYLLNGGQLFCICSDLMYTVLHTFTTAEVREHELVRFSYGDWQQVKMMHHIFCYQASPAKKQFSKDSDHSNHSSNGSSPLAPRPPSTVELHFNDKEYNIQVQVLGTEETWQTPSLLLAKVKDSRGRAVFSQVHLEIDPDEYENDEDKYESLRSSNKARLEILRDLLSKHLDMACDESYGNVEFTPGYFLGRYDLKMNLLSDCESIVNSQMACDKINVVFCGNKVDPGVATNIRLPVMIHSCPSNFSTLNYFETLQTEHIGRMVIYADILTSSQHVLSKKLRHGLVVIPKQQTNGVGRSNNTWLSPIGCAMFSLQLHVPMDSTLGRSLPIVQHMMMVAIVSAIKNLQGCEDLNLGIKWPNDLYADSSIKIGGLIVNSVIYANLAVVNIGCGVNLSNQNPTTCINDLIERLNREKGTTVKPIAYEQYFAIVFNEMESLFNTVQNSGMDYLFDTYYKYWLHSNADVTVQNSKGESNSAKIVGIDEYGYLQVRLQNGELSTVQPDGNTFDMMKGLIAPKHF